MTKSNIFLLIFIVNFTLLGSLSKTSCSGKCIPESDEEFLSSFGELYCGMKVSGPDNCGEIRKLIVRCDGPVE